MKNTIVKELFIILLFVLVIIGTLRIVLYDFIPSKEDIPEATKYVSEPAVSKILKEINDSENTLSNNTETELLLKSYTIEESDLKSKTYKTGKENPFDNYIENSNSKNSNKR